jgi:hypothetical protein
MSFQINPAISALIKVNGKELILDHGNFLKVLHIRASALDALPSLHFEFVDVLKLVPSLGLNDGAQIEVQIISNVKIVRNFRVHTWSQSPTGDGFSYSVDAYWDAPKYLMGTTQAGVKGASSEVLKTIANTCGLGISASNQSTADQMVWLPANKTYSAFARDIARHGYRSDTSHMVLAVDSHGTMRYWDVNSNEAPTVTLGFLQPPGAEKFMLITDFTPVVESGVNNLIGGYKHSRYVQDVTTKTTIYDTIKLDSDAKIPTVNFDVRTAIGDSFNTHSPIGFGNVHPYYEQAWVQNIRYNLLNAAQGQFLFNQITNWEPLDNFNYVAPAELNNDQHNGEHTVVTKIVFIAGADYAEKLIAVRNGINS